MIHKQVQLATGRNGTEIVISYVEWPSDGPPVVLLHGLMGTWRFMSPFVPALAASGWHVIAPDFRGHGDSGREQGCYSGEYYSADIRAFLEHEVKRPAILLGHSLGGLVALYLAATLPNAVRAIIIGDSPITMDELKHSFHAQLFAQTYQLMLRNADADETAQALGEMKVELPALGGKTRVREIPGYDAAFLRFWAASLLKMDPDALRMTVDGSASRNWPGRVLFDNVACPVLLLQANPMLGGLLQDADVEYAVQRNPGTVHVRLDRLGHSLQLIQAEPVIRPVMNFLDSL